MDAASACASSDLSELTSLAGEPDPTALAALLAQRGRNAFLAALKERGIGLADRSAIADAIAAQACAGEDDLRGDGWRLGPRPLHRLRAPSS